MTTGMAPLRRLAVGLTICALALVSIAGCGSSNTSSASSATSHAKFKLVQPGYLTVATYGTFPPVIVSGPGNKLGGLDGAWLNTFASAHHLKIKLYNTTFPSVLLATEQGKADVGTYYYYTAQRATQVYYGYPWVKLQLAMITLKSTHYQNVNSLKGDKIGTTVGQAQVPYLQTALGPDLMLYPTDADAAQALLNGQVTGIVEATTEVGAPPLAGTGKVTAHPLPSGTWGMPDSTETALVYNIVDCGNNALMTEMDKTMKSMRKSGAWDKALKKSGLGAASQTLPLQQPAEHCGS